MAGEIAEAKTVRKRVDQVRSGQKREPSLAIPVAKRGSNLNPTKEMVFGAAGTLVKAQSYRAFDVSPRQRSEDKQVQAGAEMREEGVV